MGKALRLSVCVSATAMMCANGQAQVELLDYYPSLSFAKITDIQSPQDGSGRLFAVEQQGIVKVFPDDPLAASSSVFLDLTSKVTSGGEMGLLGLAFHPSFGSNGHFFVNYTVDDGTRRTVVSRFTVSSPGADTANTSSELTILELIQPYSNHNGGQLQFGSDGYLYVALGDGGGQNDPDGNGQNKNNLLGTILRLDVDGAAGSLPPDCGSGLASSYQIPPDNPFVGAEGCDEIFAYGLRNPWRFSFDDGGRMWVADVGESSREEVDWVVSGGNYGWDTMEGSTCHEPLSGCSMSGLELPVWEYAHSGSASITGGYVYGGTICASQLGGKYVFADFVEGDIVALSFDGSGVTSSEPVASTGKLLSTFGVDEDGELLVGVWDQPGEILRISCTGLAVEYVTFSAVVSALAVNLTWSTASEVNNTGFEILHLTESGEWVVEGFEAARGERTGLTHYSRTVEVSRTGVHAFRLRQVDHNGTRTIGPTVEVVVPAAPGTPALDIFPHPVSGQATLVLRVGIGGLAEVVLFDVLGRKVRSFFSGFVPDNSEKDINVKLGNLSPGLYLVRAVTPGGVAHRNVLLLD